MYSDYFLYMYYFYLVILSFKRAFYYSLAIFEMAQYITLWSDHWLRWQVVQ